MRALRKRVGEHLRAVVAELRGRDLAPRFPTLEAELSDAGRELVRRVRGSLPPEGADWQQVRDLLKDGQPRRDGGEEVLWHIARDPRFLFNDLASDSPPSEPHPPGYRGPAIHWGWFHESIPELYMALIASGLIERDEPLNYGEWTAIRLACRDDRDPRLLRALCADLGIRLPHLYEKLIHRGWGTSYEPQQFAAAIERDRADGRSQHLHRRLPGAPSAMEIFLHRATTGGFGRWSQFEVDTLAQVLDSLLDAGVDPTEPCSCMDGQQGKRTPLEILLLSAADKAPLLSGLAAHLLERRPDLTGLVPNFGGLALVAESDCRAVAADAELFDFIGGETFLQVAEALKRIRIQVAQRALDTPPSLSTAIARSVRTQAARVSHRGAPQLHGRHVDPRDPGTSPTKIELEYPDGNLRTRCDDLGIAFPCAYQVDQARPMLWREGFVRAKSDALAADLANGTNLDLEKLIPGAPSLLAAEINAVVTGVQGYDDMGYPGASSNLLEREGAWRSLLGQMIDAGANPGECIWVRHVGRITPLEALLTSKRYPYVGRAALDLIARQPRLMDLVPEFPAVAKDAAQTWRAWGAHQAQHDSRENGLAAMAAAADLDAVRVIYEQKNAAPRAGDQPLMKPARDRPRGNAVF